MIYSYNHLIQYKFNHKKETALFFLLIKVKSNIYNTDIQYIYVNYIKFKFMAY